MVKQKGNGLQSSAGLMRYFDADKKAITFKPIYVLIAGVVVSLFVLLLSYFYGVWPLTNL
ncbi:MAG: preprotein translocase subunit Sec61beta [Methanosarcinales archaeon]|jgi:preprotein translocase subunit Sec61beta|nr:preprotein translocase subunit Sec61beta [Methanosarcinales archaeon]